MKQKTKNKYVKRKHMVDRKLSIKGYALKYKPMIAGRETKIVIASHAELTKIYLAEEGIERDVFVSGLYTAGVQTIFLAGIPHHTDYAIFSDGFSEKPPVVLMDEMENLCAHEVSHALIRYNIRNISYDIQDPEMFPRFQDYGYPTIKTVWRKIAPEIKQVIDEHYVSIRKESVSFIDKIANKEVDNGPIHK